MKKWVKILLNIVGCFIFYLILCAIIEYYTFDSELGSTVSISIIALYGLILSIISYCKGLNSILTRNFGSSVFLIPIIVVSLSSAHNNYNWARSWHATKGVVSSTEKIGAGSLMIPVIVYTLFYIGIWSFILFVADTIINGYCQTYMNISSLNFVDLLLTITFVSILTGVLIVVINGLILSIREERNKKKKLKKQ